MTKAMVYKLLEEFNGTLALKDAKKAGISPVTIKRMVDRAGSRVSRFFHLTWSIS